MRVVRVGVAVAAFLVNSLGAQSLPATAEQPVAPSTTASRALPPPAHTTDRMDLPVPPGAFHASDYARLPTAMRDLPFIAGTAGNDVGQTNALRNLAYEAVLARDFDSLNEVEAYLRTSRSRLSGGTSELTAFLGGVTRALRGLEDDFAPCTLKGIDFVKAWAAKDPPQPGAYLTEAELRLDYAWCFRGSGVASTVTADAWLRFHENIDAAYRTLTEHADVARIDPGYYQIMEQIYRAQGRRAADFQRLLDEASSREPYYYDIYFDAADHALPQWGGSWEEVDRIARYALEHTKERDGDGAYARVYWYIDSCGCGVSQYPIDHALLAQAIADINARTPSAWNAASLAVLACHVDDAALAAKLFAAIAVKQFPRGALEDAIGGAGRDEWERCREFAGLAPH